MERRRVRALSARTEFVPGYGMISFDSGSGREELRFPLIPVDAIPTLVRNGWVADDVDAPVEAEPEAEPEAEAPVADAPVDAPVEAEKSPKPAKSGRFAKAASSSDDAPVA